MPQGTRQHGYVLVITLVLVMIATLATVGASRFALANARQAMEAQDSLQRRWGTLSIERALLPAVEPILSDEEKDKREPLVSCRRSITLGPITFSVLLADEQAKLNPNAIVITHERTDAESEVRKMLSGIVPAARVILRLPPEPNRQAPIGCFGDVLDSFSPGELLASRFGTASPADVMTCWGDRRLNVFRASTDSLRRGLPSMIGTGGGEQLARLRTASPRPALADLLRRLDVPAQQRQRLASAVTDHSDCHSLWIISSQPDHGTHYRFAVQTNLGQRGLSIAAFEW